MAAQSIQAPRKRATKPPVKRKSRQLKPMKGSKSEAILALATATPANQIQIAEAVNVSRQCVSATLKRYGIEYNNLESYKKSRGDVFAGLQDKLLESVDIEDIKEASILQRITAAGILYDKERLETGKSTSNFAVLLSEIQQLQKERQGESSS